MSARRCHMVSWYHTVLLCSRWFMLRYAWGVQRQHGKRHPLRHTCLQCLCIDSNLLHLVLLVTISSPFLLLFIRIKTSAPLLLLLIERSRCCFNRHFFFSSELPKCFLLSSVFRDDTQVVTQERHMLSMPVFYYWTTLEAN